MGRTKSNREENDISPISPSKFRSPSRYVEDDSDDYRDKDEPVWLNEECPINEEELECYCVCTKHLPKDTALAILRDLNYDIAAAVDKCNAIETIPDLSLLERKVLLSSAPIPYANLAVKGRAGSAIEKHVFGLLPHIRPSAIQNFYNQVGRDSCIPPRGWVPKVGHILPPTHNRLMKEGLITSDEDSPLYEKPGKRVLRSSTITPEGSITSMPRKIGRNNLAIAMVGYDQNKSGDEGSSPDRRSIRTLPLNRFVRSVSVDRRPLPSLSQSIEERMSREDQPKRGRGRPRKTPIALVSSPPSSPLSTSSSSSNGTHSSPNGRKRQGVLDIDMNWSPIDNGVRKRRPSAVMEENGEWLREKIRAKDHPSTSRLPAGTDRNGGESSTSSSRASSPVEKKSRHNRSASLLADSPVSNENPFSPPRKSRDKLRIDMVGWHQQPISPTRDRDGFVVPPLPRSPLKSPSRSRQPSLSPPASPEI